jgi:hypothetical protein
MAKHDELIARYEKGVSVLEQALNGVPATMLDRVPAPGKWAIRQLAAHVADAEMVSNTRFRWIVAEPGAALAGWDQDKWATSLNYATETPAQALALVRLLRQSSARLLRSLPEEAWQRTGVHSESGVVTLEQMVEGMCNHMENHARQVREIREKFAGK